MRSEPEDSSWDFTPVLNLITALSSRDVTSPHNDTARPALNPHSVKDDYSGSTSGLGNFSRLWDYLGQPQDLPPPTFGVENLLPTNGEFDGLIDISPVLKGVRWRDELDGAGLEENDEIAGANTVSKPTKKQRKLANRLRRSQELIQQLEAKKGNPPNPKLPSDIDSDNELQRLRLSPARKASLHFIRNATSKNNEIRNIHYSSSPPSSTSPVRSPPELIWPVSNPHRLNPARPPWAPPKSHIEPLVAMSGPNKNAKLTKDLIRRFEAQKASLMNPFQLHSLSTAMNVHSNSLHVFVDASNVRLLYPRVVLLACL